MKRLIPFLFAAVALAFSACSPLSTDLDTNRARMISWLADYRDAGEFPVNRGTEPKAIFIDDEGRLCAVAYLMTRSGYGDLVQQLATTDNNALIRNLLGRDDVAAWVKISGLTIDELANIQEPAYEPTGQLEPTDPQFVATIKADRDRIQAKLSDVVVQLAKNSPKSIKKTDSKTKRIVKK